ncbi:hypothetical protein GCM10010185_35720 [Saccharothrix coeruleofusca]|uniref:Calcineurin-like phosphoesterase domain-containing protein n=1 Tax=Saccharothrix coeruleofusca TaxID=33919 RepID=A0A918AN43_9PSEU|nr:hypothetical protein GCM10010185_35720 [Saccharothrix coeruleofusca]
MEVVIPDGSLVLLVDVALPGAVPGDRLDEVARRLADREVVLVEGGAPEALLRLAKEAGARPVAVSAHRKPRGFRRVHLTGGEPVELVVEPLPNDLRRETGPFDVIGDVHGCAAELARLLRELGYRDGAHPEGRKAVFVGDLVDRGPDTPGVLRLVMDMVRAGRALCVRGNHEEKFVRALRGRDVRVTHGLELSLAQMARETPEFRAEVVEFCDSLVPHYRLDGGRLVVAHAGLPERFHGRESSRARSTALYGVGTGERDERGFPVRLPWADDYRGDAMVLYGHTVVEEPRWVNGTLCLDTGCVFGGRLTALRYPEREIVSVPALRVWYSRGG